MKKMIVNGLCLAALFTAGSINAINTNVHSAVIVVENADDRKAVKPEELPDAVKSALATDELKEWKINEAALVTPAKAEGADAAVASESYYEVTLTKGVEKKTLKVKADGTILG